MSKGRWPIILVWVLAGAGVLAAGSIINDLRTDKRVWKDVTDAL